MNAVNFHTCRPGRTCWLSNVMVAVSMLALLAPVQPGVAQQFTQRAQAIGLGRVSGTNGVAGGATQLSSSALWFDYDHDGDLDLYVSNWEDMALQAGDRDTGNWLYENLGDGTFLDASEASGLADRGLTWTSVALDANQDGLLDVYLANDFGRNKFCLNAGDKTFQEMTTDFGLEDIHHGMGVAIADSDKNGYFDIYLTNITESGYDPEINPLFLNTGENRFTHRSVDAGVSLAGWGWGTEFFDLENDGDEDLFVATGYFLPEYANVLFRNTMEAGGFGFEKMAQTVGLGEAGVVERIAIAWPNGHVDDVGSVLVDQTIRIKKTVGLVAGEPTSIDDEPTLPGVLRVLGNYPNPFNRSTHIRFALAEPGNVEVTIFDALRRSIDILQRSFSTAGEQMILL